MPIAAGSPKWTGAPWARGNREQIRVAFTACSGVSGRIDTTIGPREPPRRPARDVRAIHRHVHALLDVPHRHARREQRVLERERAADHERRRGRRASAA